MKFMFKFDLKLSDKILTKQFAIIENLVNFRSHKPNTNSLAVILEIPLNGESNWNNRITEIPKM